MTLAPDVIEIKPEDYGIWYIDCMDQPERYKDRVVEFTATVLKTLNSQGPVCAQRMAMTCCGSGYDVSGLYVQMAGSGGLQDKNSG